MVHVDTVSWVTAHKYLIQLSPKALSGDWSKLQQCQKKGFFIKNLDASQKHLKTHLFQSALSNLLVNNQVPPLIYLHLNSQGAT